MFPSFAASSPFFPTVEGQRPGQSSHNSSLFLCESQVESRAAAAARRLLAAFVSVFVAHLFGERSLTPFVSVAGFSGRHFGGTHL